MPRPDERLLSSPGMQGTSCSLLGSARSGDENSPAGIPDILLIPGLTESESGQAGKNVLAQVGKWSERGLSPVFFGGWGVLATGPKQCLCSGSQEEVSTVCLLFFSSDVEESQDRVHFEWRCTFI